MTTVALMCNLYRMTKPVDEVAQLFETSNAAAGSNSGSEVYPGYPGLVIADGELKAMAWGFPLAMRSERTGEPLKLSPSTTLGRTSLVAVFGAPVSNIGAASFLLLLSPKRKASAGRRRAHG